jgi:hypothetical protein
MQYEFLALLKGEKIMKKPLCILLWLALTPILWGQTAQKAIKPPFKASGAFFALSVADIEASTKWYSEKLDLKIIKQMPKENKVAVTVLEGGGLIVELIQHDDALPLSEACPSVKDNLLVHGIFKAGVIVNNLDNTLAKLRARYVEIAFGPFPAGPNQRANFIIKDNAGNLIQFFGK